MMTNQHAYPYNRPHASYPFWVLLIGVFLLAGGPTPGFSVLSIIFFIILVKIIVSVIFSARHTNRNSSGYEVPVTYGSNNQPVTGQKQIFCNECGTSVLSRSQYCIACGTKF